MGWTSVALVKNELNEYRFCVIPNIENYYSGPPGGASWSYITIGGNRNMNAEPGSANFQLGKSYVNAVWAQYQDGQIENMVDNPQTTFDKYIYGTTAGEALRLYEYYNGSGSGYDRRELTPYKYWNNMQSNQQIFLSSQNIPQDRSKLQYFYTGWVLLINHDTEQCFAGKVYSVLRWNESIGVPRYYDNATVAIYLFDANPEITNLYSMFKDSIPSGSGSNPYADGGLSGPGGGEDQNFDEVSDVIDLPTLPTYGATGTGFITAFCPTVQEINDVADYLIQPNIAQVIQGLFAKMSDIIVGLHLLPFTVDASNSKNIELHALAFSIDTQVSSHYADNQYQRLPMGSIDVLKCWDNCLDYNPYTFVSIYLPFCGYFELDTDEVMGKTLTVVYDVDIITGSCVALIQVDGSVMYQFSGMCSCQIPITSVDFNQAVQSLIGLGASAAAGIKMIKGAAAATEEAASRAMAPQNNLSRQLTYENYMEAKMNEQEIKESMASRLANASVNAVISGKGNYMHAGAVSSAPGFLACRKPFLIIKRPKQSVPEDYETMRGFPSNMKATLGDLSGYTEVDDIHLNIPDATVDEIVECERLLKGGVYL